MIKKLLIAGTFALLFVQHAPVYAEQTSTHYLTDVKNTHWAAEEIMTLVNAGQMDVYEDGSFRPNAITTRAEAAAVIARTMGTSLESDFELQAIDVPTTHPYYAEIRKLAELGIIQNSEWFNPNEPLKRAHISKMIALAYNITVDEKNKVNFKDLPKNYWAKHYIESLADASVVTGKTTTTFEPNSYVTRAHVAALTVRGMKFAEKVKKHEVIYDYLSKDYIATVTDRKKWGETSIEAVNKIRIEKGLKPLLYDAALSQLAVIKAQDMIEHNYFDHYSSYYGNPWDMATLFDYDYTSFGENIARNFNSVTTVVDAWMASPTHRENILKSSYTHIGIGVKQARNGNFYWVQLFSSK
ncbi:S-layer homology domain-containing protein [Solibacillus sp. CAU 1738]|uniref:CAP and S-layer homology domain-containing protein n=1 Tax=Solibacillus sp. CAU 1738 TaxID=3140363 RepID=UPI00326162EE